MEAYLNVSMKCEIGPVDIPDHMVAALRPGAVITFVGPTIEEHYRETLGVTPGARVVLKVTDAPAFVCDTDGPSTDLWTVTVNCEMEV